MKIRLLLRVSALYLGAVGGLALLTPRSAMAGLRRDPTAFDRFTTQTVGTALTALAITNWSAPPGRGILLANLVLNAVLGAVDTAAVADGTLPAGARQGVAIHVGLVTAYAWALHAQRGDTRFAECFG